MLRFFVGTQVNCQSLVFQISTTSSESLQPLSSICSRSKPFRPVEHLAVCRRWNNRANKSGDSPGEWSCVSIILIFLCLQILSESRLRFLQIFSVRSTFWLALFGFEISRSVQIWVISVFYALFPYSIQQYLPWSSPFLTGSFVLYVFDFYRELHMFCWQGAVPSPESS